jgi:hypothetical protein
MYVARFDPETEELTVIADTLGPQTIAVDVYQDASGDIYVLGLHSPTRSGRAVPKLAVMLDGQMPPIEIWEFADSSLVLDLMVNPWGLRKGHVMALSSNPGYLIELERTGPTSFEEYLRVDIPGNPTAFALDRAGNAIALDDSTGMYVFGLPDTLIPFGSAVGPGLKDICVASDGTIYVSNDTLDVVHRFDSDGVPVLPDLSDTMSSVGTVVSPLFTPTSAGVGVTVEPLEGIVTVFEEVAEAGYTMAAATHSSLRVSPMGNRLPDYALLPASPGGPGGRAEEFIYIGLLTTARHKNLIQVDVYEEGSRFFFASGVNDTFRDFTVTGSYDDARGTIPRFGDQIHPPGRLNGLGDHLVEIVLVDDERPLSTVIERKIARTDTAMSVPSKKPHATAVPHPEQNPEDEPDGDREGTEPCPWGQIRRLRRYLQRAAYEYGQGHPATARSQLEDLNAELRYLGGWCIPDSSDARLGNLVGEMLAHSKTLHWSLGEWGTGVDPGEEPGPSGLAIQVPASPVDGRCVFHISGAKGRDIRLAMYNAAGRLVADVFEGRADAGRMVLTWDGRDRRGERVASGVYFARLTSRGEKATSAVTSKVVLVR